MFKHFVFVLCAIAAVSGQTWVSRAHLDNHREYWMRLMHGLVAELEQREWCNLKLNDISQVINDNFYELTVSGTVNYVNGFVVSIQKIDVIDIDQSVNTRTVDGEAVPFGTVRGKLNFWDMLIGYEVVANLTSPHDPNFRSTGTFLHSLVQIQLDLYQNLQTKDLTGWSMIVSVSSGSGVRMQYLPANNVTQALGRRFSASTFDSAALWARNIFVPTIIHLAANEYGFPDVCFNNCAS